jgi:ribonuclease HII
VAEPKPEARRRQQALGAEQVLRAKAMWRRERELAGAVALVAGVDEAGRGCLAGPVVAAAVVLQGAPEAWAGLADSKTLTRAARERFAAQIRREALGWAVGVADVAEIDRWNILQAARLAMARAVAGLPFRAPLVLVDGTHIPWYQSEADHVPSVPVVDGDATCLSIAAASIVAKVTRDQMMAEWDAVYPQYGFARNAGYGTPEHLEALRRYGPCPLHRTSFAPVRRILQGE